MKRLLALLLTSFLVLFLVGCSSSDTTTTTEDTDKSVDLTEEIIGTWVSANKVSFKAENGKEEEIAVSLEYTFNEDGTYALNVTDETEADGSTPTIDTVDYAGTYKLKGDELITTVKTINGDDAVNFKVEETAPSWDEVHTYLTDGKNIISIEGDTLTISTEYKYGDNDNSIEQEFTKTK